MKSSNNGGDNALTRHLLSSNEMSSARNGLYLIELLAKGTTWKTPDNSGF